MKLVLLMVVLVVGVMSCSGEKEKAGMCELCEYVVGFVEKWVADNKTEEAIEKDLERVCNLLPSQYADECKEIIEEYLPFIINFVEEELPAKKVCQLVGLCPSSNGNEVNKGNDELCTICKYIVNIVDSLLKDNKTEEEIISTLEKYCNLLPGSYAEECKALVDQFLPVIIDWVETKTPEQICDLIKMCDATEELLVEEEEQNLDTCDLCEWVAKAAEGFLAKNKTEEQIMEELHKLCSILPSEYESLCKTMVDEYLPTIIDYIEQSFPPKMVCQYIGLCPKQKKMDFHITTTIKDDNSVLGCIKDCLADKYSWSKILMLVAQCGTDLDCYKSQVASDVFDCIMGCF